MSVTYLNTNKCTYNKKVLNINKYFEIYNKKNIIKYIIKILKIYIIEIEILILIFY